MSSWTSEQVLALAPDAASASAGQALASTKKWTGLGSSDRAIWGACQGSGKDPYQTRVDLTEPAFKCSCPSRKFPCKHGLGLMLLLARDPAAFPSKSEPGWVTEWIAGRVERSEKKVERARVAAEKPIDPEAQAKRVAQREARVSEGVAGCRLWLEDLLRRGLAAAQSESPATWDRMAARLVDAQAPGLASYVRRIPELLASGAGWDARTLDHLGKLHLLLRGADQLAQLRSDLAVDIRTALGWNQAREEVLAGPGLPDRWVALAQVTEEEERLRVRRTWLIGRESRRRALLLDFAAGSAPFEQSPAAGTEFDAELAFYPGALPLRALLKSRGEAHPIDGNLGRAASDTIEPELREYAEALAANPWIVRWPLVIAGSRVAQEEDQWCLADRTDSGLPLKPSFASALHLWRLVSVSTGADVVILAEWDGEFAVPLSAITAGVFHDLSPRLTS